MKTPMTISQREAKTRLAPHQTLQEREELMDHLMLALRAELLRAMGKHAPMNSPHEGHSVIREEVEELWDHVKADTGTTEKARSEALQVAAMGLRYVIDLVGY